MAEKTPDPLHKCTRCDLSKTEAAFHRDSKRANGLQAWCKECKAESHKLRKYKVSAKDFDAMLEAQGGKCAICRVKFRSLDYTGPICIDHKHHEDPEVEKLRIGKVRIRGLCCSACNLGLGHVKDDRLTLLRMIDYLTSHSTQEEREEDEGILSQELGNLMGRLKLDESSASKDKKKE